MDVVRRGLLENRTVNTSAVISGIEGTVVKGNWILTAGVWLFSAVALAAYILLTPTTPHGDLNVPLTELGADHLGEHRIVHDDDDAEIEIDRNSGVQETDRRVEVLAGT